MPGAALCGMRVRRRSAGYARGHALGFALVHRQCRQYTIQALPTRQATLKAPTMATKQPKATTKQPKAQAAAPASPMPTVAAPVAPQAPAATRGMPVAVRIGAQYRCAAAHNMQWWQALQAACAAGGGQAELAPLLAAAKGATAANPGTAGAPGHFVGYALRKGYLVPAA